MLLLSVNQHALCYKNRSMVFLYINLLILYCVTWLFLVYKDGGKEEKKKSSTSSPVKCYFVRMESNWIADQEKPYILSDKFIHESRAVFMHVQTVSSLSKYMARFSFLIFFVWFVNMSSLNFVYYFGVNDNFLYVPWVEFIDAGFLWSCPKRWS